MEGTQEMKKMLGLALALAISSSAIAANAEILKNLKTKGEINVLGVMDQNVTDLQSDRADDFRHTRAMINYGVMFDLLDDLHANITLIKCNRSYGQAAEDLNTIQSSVFVHEANIQLDKVAENFNLKIGRQFYGNHDDLVIYYGPTAVLQEGYAAASLDAVRVDLANSEKHTAHLIWAKVNEPGPNATDNGTSLIGIRDDYKMSDDMTLGGYVYNRRIGNVNYGQNSDNLYVFGVKAIGKFMGFGYNLEAVGNAGKGAAAATESPAYKGYAYTGKVNYKIDSEFGGFNPRAMYAYGSGDSQGLNGVANKAKNTTFTAINSDFRPGLIFGMSDLAGANFGNVYGLNGTYYNQGSLANLTVLNIGLDYMPKFSEKLSFLVDFYNFKINKDCTGAVGDDKTIGSELDLNVNYKFAENVSFGIAGGHFMPGKMIKKLATAGNVQANPANKLASYITVKW